MWLLFSVVHLLLFVPLVGIWLWQGVFFVSANTKTVFIIIMQCFTFGRKANLPFWSGFSEKLKYGSVF